MCIYILEICSRVNERPVKVKYIDFNLTSLHDHTRSLYCVSSLPISASKHTLHTLYFLFFIFLPIPGWSSPWRIFTVLFSSFPLLVSLSILKIVSSNFSVDIFSKLHFLSLMNNYFVTQITNKEKNMLDIIVTPIHMFYVYFFVSIIHR